VPGGLLSGTGSPAGAAVGPRVGYPVDELPARIPVLAQTREKVVKKLFLLAAMALSAADMGEFMAAMKTTGQTMGPMMKALSAGSMADVAAGAKKLEDVFTVSEKYWTAEKVADATKWSQEALAASKELSAAAAASDTAAAKAAIGKMAATCKACHDAHREKLPDGTYKIK